MDKLKAYQKLLADMEIQFSRIPESYFKKFLPLLVESDSLDNEDYERLRLEWLEVCIDPRLSVNVMSEDGKTLLFRVPPLVYTTRSLVGKDVVGTVKEWILRNEVSPMHGTQFARAHIDSKLLLDDMPEEDKVAWQTVLSRYNYLSGGNASVDVELDDADDDW